MVSEKRYGAEEWRHRDWSKIGREFEVYEKKIGKKNKEKLRSRVVDKITITKGFIQTHTYMHVHYMVILLYLLHTRQMGFIIICV